MPKNTIAMTSSIVISSDVVWESRYFATYQSNYYQNSGASLAACREAPVYSVLTGQLMVTPWKLKLSSSGVIQKPSMLARVVVRAFGVPR